MSKIDFGVYSNNPKRKVTFLNRFGRLLEIEIREARLMGDYDYEMWLTNKMVKNSKTTNRIVKNIK